MQSLMAIAGSLGFLLLSATAIAMLFVTRDARDTRDQAQRLRPLLAAGLLLCLPGILLAMPVTVTVLARVVALLLVVAATWWLPADRSRGKTLILPLVAAAVALEVASSHAQQSGDWLGAAAGFLHWSLVIAWAGSLLAVFMASGSVAGDRDSLRRHARLALFCMAGLAASGALLAFVLVHNGDAMQTSSYGGLLRFKLYAASCLLPLAILQLRRLAGPAIARERPALYAEAACLLLLSLPAGLAGNERPPAHAPFINPQSWQLETGHGALQVDLQPVAGRPGRLRLEFLLPADGSDDNLGFSLLSLDGAAGERDLEALPAGPGSYLGEATVAMPGTWQLQVVAVLANGERLEASATREIPAPPLADDMRSQLLLKTIGWSPANLLTFAIGVLLLAVATWSLRLRLRSATGDWLAAISICSLLLGAYLLLSVSYVKTYPGSFDENPEPFVTAVVRHGETLYQAHCSNCHGVSGRGDGAWALDRGGPIPDLSVAHMDTHLDGEIFWWLSYGIPSLDMPGFADELSENERWKVVHFLRSLRHAVPAE